MGKSRLLSLGFAWVVAVHAQPPSELETSPLAVAFGSAPMLTDVRLSPSGTKMSAIETHSSGKTLLRVIDLATGDAEVLVSGDQENRLTWCDWANEMRLLCGARAFVWRWGRHPRPIVATRLLAVSIGRPDPTILLEGQSRNRFVQYQYPVIDWLPDEPNHVLVQVPYLDFSGVARLDVHSGKLLLEGKRGYGILRWITDGLGTPRLRNSVDGSTEIWQVRDTPEWSWSMLRETDLTEPDGSFSPIGFTKNRDELLYYGLHEGRMALFAMDLVNGSANRLVYSHERYDVAGVHSLGKYERVVAALYFADRMRMHFTDDRVAEIHSILSDHLTGQLISILDEDWNRRYYLVYVSSAADAGAYYRFDSEDLVLAKIAVGYPALTERELAPMASVTYRSGDGVPIPAYLTLPVERQAKVPAIVLPRDGLPANDYWSYDFLSQFLAASGYAVLQIDIRGSAGHAVEWPGIGDFHDWHVAVGDILAGTRYLINEGIADPLRICVVGWSYGGYAALMSALENPQTYRCVVSIAGATDPAALGNYMLNFVGGRGVAQALIGTHDDVIEDGSPVDRAREITFPVLLVHGGKDVNVPLDQSLRLHRALRRADKEHELIEYEHAEHDIVSEHYRIDLLARLGRFLDKHAGQPSH